MTKIPSAGVSAVKFIFAVALTSVSVAASADVFVQSETLFANVRVFDGTKPVLSNLTSVLVRGNVIFADWAERESIGASHNHRPWSQSDAMADGMTAAKMEVRAAQEAEAMLMRGFTAARDLGGPVWGLKAGIDFPENIRDRASGHLER